MSLAELSTGKGICCFFLLGVVVQEKKSFDFAEALWSPVPNPKGDNRGFVSVCKISSRQR